MDLSEQKNRTEEPNSRTEQKNRRDNRYMRVELLHIDKCPHSAEARGRVEAALAGLGHGDVEVHMRLLQSAADTLGTGFAGSPTITLDGADIFPGGAPTNGLACRIYKTPTGHAGLPTVDQLTDALKNHGL
jgi:hypothetical protein